ncbi:MAG: hypothetical protein ACREBE_11035 [bacterium]
MFLRACFARLMNETTEDLLVEPRKAAQYRFEIERRLRTYFQAAGPPLAFVFLLTDRGTAVRQGFVGEDYPATSGYVLLVTHARPEVVAQPSEQGLREFLVRLVEDAARAEFAAYAAMPAVNLSLLEGLFVPDGSAYRRIQNIVEQRAKDRWTIRVPEYNPSTMRVLSVRVSELSGTTATVYTQEYWYLRWWSEIENHYAYIYNETNHQRYLLAHVGDRWLVDANIYPPPRATTAKRRARTV